MNLIQYPLAETIEKSQNLEFMKTDMKKVLAKIGFEVISTEAEQSGIKGVQPKVWQIFIFNTLPR
jgi:hypothetical protein